MPFSVVVRLRHGRYEAGGLRAVNAEWPPHPARVVCALAASAENEAGWDALRWLESQQPPQVWSDPAASVRTGHARAYVVENATSPKGGNLSWPGRNNGMRSRAFAVPATGSFAIVWPQATPSADVQTRIRELARKVPYVGRSTSVAELTAISVLPERAAHWVTHEVVSLGNPAASCELRVPYIGYVDELQAAYSDGRRSWTVDRVLPYAQADSLSAQYADAGSAVEQGPFEDLLVWSLTRPLTRIGGDQVVALTSALRRAVISRVDEPVPAQVSGHGAEGRPHVGFLAIPDVGHHNADGHILGLALAVPRGLPAADLERLIKAVVVAPMSRLRITRDRCLDLEYGADRNTIQPSRWGSRGGSAVWSSVTPLMLDGHLRRGRDVASEVGRSFVIAGYPEPADIEVSEMPLVEGGVWRPRNGSMPSGRPQRELFHARVTFPSPIRGPVLAGSMRYLGLGLFLPVGASRSMQFEAEAQ
jgi:CRISPR-associated protein Csb2